MKRKTIAILTITLIALVAILSGCVEYPHSEETVETQTPSPKPTPTPEPAVTLTSPTTLTPTPRPLTPTPSPIVNQTTHGRIRWDEIWRGEVHITGDIVVEQGATLTIEPGTVVCIAGNQDVENLFEAWPFNMQQGICPEDDFFAFAHGVHRGEPYRDEDNHTSIRVFGTLHAVGTPEQMIIITSDSPNPGIYDWNFFDFAHGILSYSVVEYYRCLNPGDGTEVSHNILRHIGECGVCANSLVVVEHNTISYAGHELVDMHNSSPVIRNNHLGPNPGHAGIVIDGASPQIINNTIEGCETGIKFISPPSDPNIEGNTFSNNVEDIEHEY